MSFPDPSQSRSRSLARFARPALRLLPLALALSLTMVAAADTPPPAPPVPPAPPAAPAAPVAPRAPTTEQARELEAARQELERAARRLADLHREYGMAAAPHPGHMPPGPAWAPMAPDRPRIGAVLANDDVRGVRIAAVTPDGPAAKAGLRSGDRLLAVGETTLDGASADERQRDARLALHALPPDKPVRLRYERDGKAATVSVTPERGARVMVFSGDGRMFAPEHAAGAAWGPRDGMPGGAEIEVLQEMPEAGEAPRAPGVERRVVVHRQAVGAQAAAVASARVDSALRRVEILRYGPGDSALQRIEHDCDGDGSCTPLPLLDAFRWSGLNLAAMDAKLGRYFGTSEGVLVLGAGAGLDGLEPGDVIRKVDGRRVRTPREVMETLRGKEAGAEVAVEVLRERKAISARVRVPDARIPELGLVEPLPHVPELPPMPPVPAAPPAPPAPRAPPPPPPPHVD